MSDPQNNVASTDSPQPTSSRASRTIELRSGRSLDAYVGDDALVVDLEGGVYVLIRPDVGAWGEVLELELVSDLVYWDPVKTPVDERMTDDGAATVVISDGRAVIARALIGPHQTDCACTLDQEASQFRAWVRSSDRDAWLELLAALPRATGPVSGFGDPVLWRGRVAPDGALVLEQWTSDYAWNKAGSIEAYSYEWHLPVLCTSGPHLPSPPAHLATNVPAGTRVLSEPVATPAGPTGGTC